MRSKRPWQVTGTPNAVVRAGLVRPNARWTKSGEAVVNVPLPVLVSTCSKLFFATQVMQDLVMIFVFMM